jgi:hypothetical protein
MNALPKVLATSVVRSTQQGESHGGMYLVDLGTGEREQVADWDDPAISWDGRGADRGLRGIAFYDDNVLVAASDELFVYDQGFNIVDSFKNAYLNHCHEIHRAGDMLWLTSTGFDALLGMDLRAGRFLVGHRLVRNFPGRLARKVSRFPRYAVRSFDPEGCDGPPPQDRLHVNSTWVDEDRLLASGTGLRHVLQVREGFVRPYARVPRGTHNAQPFRDGMLFNHTDRNRIVYMSRRGRLKRSFPIKTYHEAELSFSSVPADHARQGFGRGLCTWEGGVVISGSSPATVSAIDFATGDRIAEVNMTLDVRNSIHGLEVWPY